VNTLTAKTSSSTWPINIPDIDLLPPTLDESSVFFTLREEREMTQLRIQVLQAWKRCLKVTGNVFKNDPPALTIVRNEARAEFMKNKDLKNEWEIKEKLEEAHGATDVIEKFVLQVVQSDHDPNHYVANMRPEMEFLELSGTPYGREDPEGEATRGRQSF